MFPYLRDDVSHRQRAYSIKTRIKTHSITRISTGDLPSQRAYSIKTRIKTDLTYCTPFALITVREHIPLKQGLRLQLDGS